MKYMLIDDSDNNNKPYINEMDQNSGELNETCLFTMEEAKQKQNKLDPLKDWSHIEKYNP